MSAAAPSPRCAALAFGCQGLLAKKRYAELSLVEENLIKEGDHVLVAYIVKPKAGCYFWATAAHFAAESSTGKFVKLSTTDDFTNTAEALELYIDQGEEVMKIAYPVALFVRNITDGCVMMCCADAAYRQQPKHGRRGIRHDLGHLLPSQVRGVFRRPRCQILDMWRLFGSSMTDGRLIVGTTIKLKLGLQPKLFGEACCTFCQGGDSIKNDEPQGNQTLCQMSDCIPAVADVQVLHSDHALSIFGSSFAL